MSFNESRRMDSELELATVSLRLTPAQMKHLAERVADRQTVCWNMTPISQLTVAVCDRLADHDGGCYDSRLKVRFQRGAEPVTLTIGKLCNPLGNITLDQDDQLWMSCEWAHRLSMRQLDMDIQPMIDKICNGRPVQKVFRLELKDGRLIQPVPDGFKLLYNMGWHEALADKSVPVVSRVIIPGVN